jgi:hypothetical protein
MVAEFCNTKHTDCFGFCLVRCQTYELRRVVVTGALVRFSYAKTCQTCGVDFSRRAFRVPLMVWQSLDVMQINSKLVRTIVLFFVLIAGPSKIHPSPASNLMAVPKF